MLPVIALVALGVYFIRKAETGEEVSTPEYYDYVMEQIEKKEEEKNTWVKVVNTCV